VKNSKKRHCKIHTNERVIVVGPILFRPAQALLALRPCDLITGEASTGH
jgi:hypothetical protein